MPAGIRPGRHRGASGQVMTGVLPSGHQLDRHTARGRPPAPAAARRSRSAPGTPSTRSSGCSGTAASSRSPCPACPRRWRSAGRWPAAWCAAASARDASAGRSRCGRACPRAGPSSRPCSARTPRRRAAGSRSPASGGRRRSSTSTPARSACSLAAAGSCGRSARRSASPRGDGTVRFTAGGGAFTWTHADGRVEQATRVQAAPARGALPRARRHPGRPRSRCPPAPARTRRGGDGARLGLRVRKLLGALGLDPGPPRDRGAGHRQARLRAVRRALRRLVRVGPAATPARGRRRRGRGLARQPLRDRRRTGRPDSASARRAGSSRWPQTVERRPLHHAAVRPDRERRPAGPVRPADGRRRRAGAARATTQIHATLAHKPPTGSTRPPRSAPWTVPASGCTPRPTARCRRGRAWRSCSGSPPSTRTPSARSCSRPAPTRCSTRRTAKRRDRHRHRLHPRPASGRPGLARPDVAGDVAERRQRAGRVGILGEAGSPPRRTPATARRTGRPR